MGVIVVVIVNVRTSRTHPPTAPQWRTGGGDVAEDHLAVRRRRAASPMQHSFIFYLIGRTHAVRGVRMSHREETCHTARNLLHNRYLHKRFKFILLINHNNGLRVPVFH